MGAWQFRKLWVVMHFTLQHLKRDGIRMLWARSARGAWPDPRVLKTSLCLDRCTMFPDEHLARAWPKRDWSPQTLGHVEQHQQVVDQRQALQLQEFAAMEAESLLSSQKHAVTAGHGKLLRFNKSGIATQEQRGKNGPLPYEATELRGNSIVCGRGVKMSPNKRRVEFPQGIKQQYPSHP